MVLLLVIPIVISVILSLIDHVHIVYSILPLITAYNLQLNCFISLTNSQFTDLLQALNRYFVGLQIFPDKFILHDKSIVVSDFELAHLQSINTDRRQKSLIPGLRSRQNSLLEPI